MFDFSKRLERSISLANPPPGDRLSDRADQLGMFLLETSIEYKVKIFAQESDQSNHLFYSFP